MNHPIFPAKARAIVQYILVAVPLLTGVATPVDAASAMLRDAASATLRDDTSSTLRDDTSSTLRGDTSLTRSGDTSSARTSLNKDGEKTSVEESGENSVTEQPLFVNIDAYGLPEGSQPLGPHSLRRSFTTVAITQLRDNAMSTERGGLVLDLFPDVVVKADKSYVELRGDDSYTWFGHSQDKPDDAVILSVVDGKLAGMVMRDGDLFHIKALESDGYEITEVDQASFPAERDDEEIDTVPLGKISEQRDALATPYASAEAVNDSGSLDANQDQEEIYRAELGANKYGKKRDISAEELGTKQYSKKRYIAVEDKYEFFFKPIATEDKSGDFSSPFSTINLGVLVTSTVAYGGDYPNYLVEIQLAVDQANLAFAASDVQIQLNLVATAVTSYHGSTDVKIDLSRLRGTADGYMDTIHATRDLWSWKADIVTLVVNDFVGDDCGRAYTLFYGSPKSDWSVNGFNVVAIDCMTVNKTLAHEVGHNLGAHHDWHVEPQYSCPAGQVDFEDGFGCITPQLDPWGPSSYSHGIVWLGAGTSLPGRSLMAYPDKCKAYLGVDCTKYLRFSDPMGWEGVPKGQYHAADNHAVLNENRTLVEHYR
jgi:hypothetical protein